VTRQFLAGLRIENGRFMRIEGVADREPYNPEDGFDPRNRRMSIILGWS
jgi:chemotaxis protein MotB